MTLNSLKAAATGQLRNRRRKALASIKPAEPAEEQPTSALQGKKKIKIPESCTKEMSTLTGIQRQAWEMQGAPRTEPARPAA